MIRPTLKYLFATLVLFFAAQTYAEDPAHPEVVPVAQEPRHRLVLEDEYIRLFDVHIPAGDTTLYHSHQRDSVYIPISGFADLVNQEHGKAAKPLLIKFGSVAFAEHSKAPFTHRVSNLGSEEFHVIDIELVGALAGSSAIGELPEGHQPVLENSRIRISRIVIEPDEFLAINSKPATHGVIVVLTGKRIGFRGDSGVTPISDIAHGNEGSERLDLISVEVK